MKYCFFIAFLVITLSASAQDDWLEATYNHSLSFGTNGFPLFYDVDVSESAWDDLQWHLQYKIQFNEVKRLRTGINFYILPETPYKYWVVGLNAGYMWMAKPFGSRLNFYAGPEIFIFHKRLEGNSPYEYRYTSRYTLGVVGGAELFILPKLSVATELAPNVGLTEFKYRSGSSSAPIDDTWIGWGFHRLLSLSLNYHFNWTPRVEIGREELEGPVERRIDP